MFQENSKKLLEKSMHKELHETSIFHEVQKMSFQ